MVSYFKKTETMLGKPFEVDTDNPGVKYLRTKKNLSEREAFSAALSRCTVSKAFQ